MPENKELINSDSDDIYLEIDSRKSSSRDIDTSLPSSITDDQAQKILSKAEGAYASLWEGKKIARPEAIAEYYEITPEEIQQMIRREEFQGELIDGGLTPRAALRVGMKLDNEIGDNIRTVAIGICQILSRENVRERIKGCLLEANMSDWSDRSIAAFLGNVNTRNTVKRVRQELQKSGEIEPTETRKYTRNGKEQEYPAKATESVKQEVKEVVRTLGLPSSGLPEAPRNEPQIEEKFPASYTNVHSINDLAIAVSQLHPQDILALLKKADQWMSDEQIEAIEQAIAHRRADREWAA